MLGNAGGARRKRRPRRMSVLERGRAGTDIDYVHDAGPFPAKLPALLMRDLEQNSHRVILPGRIRVH